MPGLDLLGLRTRYAAPKRVCPQTACLGRLTPPWQDLSSVTAQGYEIRTDSTAATDHAVADGRPTVALLGSQGEAIGWQCGSVLGIYLHGLLESSTGLKAVFGQSVRTLDECLDGPADCVDRHFAPALLAQLRSGCG